MRTHCHVDVPTHEHMLREIEERADPHWREELCRCAPLLIDLLAEMHGETTDHHRSAVRAVLVEQCRLGPAGQPRSLDERELSRHVGLMLESLEKIRRSQLEAGVWSEIPVPPQCFG